MVDVVERSAVYEMLDKIQQDVYDGDGFQHDKWVEYVVIESGAATAAVVSCMTPFAEIVSR